MGNATRTRSTNPVDYWLDYDPKDAVLTLHFTLPFKKPVKTRHSTSKSTIPQFFIDFGFAEKDPVRLVSAPAQCTTSVEKPHDDNFPATRRLRSSR